MRPRAASCRPPPDKMTNDRLLAERCCAAARQAAVAQEEEDLAATCGRVETYYDELVCRRPGRRLPRLDNPCVDFERVLREYVWSGSTGSASYTHWGRQRPELARFSAHGRFRPARPAGSLAGTSRAATGEDFLAPSGHPRHERSAKGWAKHEPAAALLSCYALVQSNSVIPLSPRTKHFLMGLRRQRCWESFPQAATLLLSGTRPEGTDTGLGAGGQARCDNFEGGKCAMSIRQYLADR